jgi:S-formylglutathione hydrolase
MLTVRSEQHCFGGTVGFYSHSSSEIGAEMRFSTYLPPQVKVGPLPVLYFLAGLTCTEETFMVKADALRFAAEHGLILVAPDTSPRGLGLPGEDDDWDFGTGAGFYIDAEAEPWRRHYRMYSYVTKELPLLVEANFPARRTGAAFSVIRWEATAHLSLRSKIPTATSRFRLLPRSPTR